MAIIVLHNRGDNGAILVSCLASGGGGFAAAVHLALRSVHSGRDSCLACTAMDCSARGCRVGKLVALQYGVNWCSVGCGGAVCVCVCVVVGYTEKHALCIIWLGRVGCGGSVCAEWVPGGFRCTYCCCF